MVLRVDLLFLDVLVLNENRLIRRMIGFALDENRFILKVDFYASQKAFDMKDGRSGLGEAWLG